MRILLSPARLGEIAILMTLLIANAQFHVIFYQAGENRILSRKLPGENATPINHSLPLAINKKFREIGNLA